jgi:hypothetical protein
MAWWRWITGGLAAVTLALGLLGGFGTQGVIGQESDAFVFAMVTAGICLTLLTVAGVEGNGRWAMLHLRSAIALMVLLASLVVGTAIAGVGRITESYDFVRAPGRASSWSPERRHSPETEGVVLLSLSLAGCGLFAFGLRLTAREIKRVGSAGAGAGPSPTRR